MTKSIWTMAVVAVIWSGSAGSRVVAQADMSCADYLKADAQMQGQMSAADKAALKADPTAAAMDDKMRAYCVANPRASAAEAMQKAMN